METAFKIIFGIAIFVFCLVIVALFLLIIKISFFWLEDITIMGINMTRA
jgi:hypothetical protein